VFREARPPLIFRRRPGRKIAPDVFPRSEKFFKTLLRPAREWFINN